MNRRPRNLLTARSLALGLWCASRATPGRCPECGAAGILATRPEAR